MLRARFGKFTVRITNFQTKISYDAANFNNSLPLYSFRVSCLQI